MGAATTLVILALLVTMGLPRSAIGSASAASNPANTIPQVGLNVNYGVPQSFINTLASDGVHWVRQYGPNTDTLYLHQAGINTLMVLNENLFYVTYPNFGYQSPAYTNVQQLTTTQWYNYVYQAAKNMPWITEWEFLNEPNLSGGGSEPAAWTPQQYFEYLVPTYQALKAANPNNVLIGPTVAWPWPINQADITSGIIDWLQQLFSQTDPTTGLTAGAMLSDVSMHIYTCCWGGAEMMSDSVGTETEGQLIQAGLAQAYAVTGKPMIIDEWGWPSSTLTSGGVTTTSSPSEQATYYQQFMNVMESTPDMAGVYAFNWADYGQPAGSPTFGVFDSSLNPQPALSTYQQYFPSDPAPTTSSSTTSTTTTSTTSSTKSTTSTSSTTAVGSGQATITVRSAYTSGTSFSGIYAEVSTNGNVVAGGLTPFTYTGTTGDQYTVSFYYYPPFGYGTVYLDHLSTGGTGSTATITLVQPTSVTAYYRTASSTTTSASSTSSSSSQTTSTRNSTTTTTSSASTSSSGPPTITVESEYTSGVNFGGIFAQITTNGNVVAAGFTPFTFTGSAGTVYTITFYYYPPYSYGTVYFRSLSTGSTSSSATITLTGSTTIIAYYSTTP